MFTRRFPRQTERREKPSVCATRNGSGDITSKTQSEVPRVRINAIQRCIIQHSHHLCSTHTFTIFVGHGQCPLFLLARLQLVTEGRPFQIQSFLWTFQFKPLHQVNKFTITHIEDNHLNTLAPFFSIWQTQMLHRSVRHTNLMIQQAIHIIHIVDDISIRLLRGEVKINCSTLFEDIVIRIDEVLFLHIISRTHLLIQSPTSDFRNRQS